MLWISILFLILFGIFLYLLYRAGQRGYWKRLSRDLQPNSQPYFEEARYGIPNLGRVGVISYTLYGNYPKYLPQLLTNLDQIREQMPQWQSRVYVSQKIGTEAIDEMVARGAEVIKMGPREPPGHEGALWRYLPGKDNLTFVSLDADDPFDKRDEIWDWYNSGTPFGLFNRNQYFLPMTAGTTGARAGTLLDIEDLLNTYSESWFGFDEAFLYQLIWPRVEAMGYWQVPGISWTGARPSFAWSWKGGFYGLTALLPLLAIIILIYAMRSTSGGLS